MVTQIVFFNDRSFVSWNFVVLVIVVVVVLVKILISQVFGRVNSVLDDVVRGSIYHRLVRLASGWIRTWTAIRRNYLDPCLKSIFFVVVVEKSFQGSRTVIIELGPVRRGYNSGLLLQGCAPPACRNVGALVGEKIFA